ncbi:MAG: hypothetical protein WD342_07805 [Verrucomicrobiales bacterium]
MKTRLMLLLAVVLLSREGWADSPAKTAPFGGKPHGIPGLIEAEHYDEGASGVAYEDVDPENRGADYREATGVDIEKRDDASNGHGIGWTKKGE